MNGYSFGSLSLTLIYYTMCRIIDYSKVIDVKNRNIICSNIHAIYIFYASAALLTGLGTPEDFKKASMFSVAYAINDIRDTIYIGLPNAKEMIFHHSLILVSFSLFLLEPLIVIPDNYHTYLAMNFMTEVTTPILNYCFYLHNNKKPYKNPAIILVLFYFIFRVINCSYITYISLQEGQYFVYKYVQIPFTLLNYYWFTKLVKKALN
jgi:hypothetical protein